MQFDVLGPLRVVGAHGPAVKLSSVAQRRLMSLLVSRAGTVVSADSLAEHLELSPGALRTSVSRLRRVVGFDVLVTEPPGYQLRSRDVDALRFEELTDEARAVIDPTVARAKLEEALTLWRGEAYDEFAYESWATGEARRLTELRAGATEDLAERLVDAGEWSTAIATIQPLIETEPFRDRPRALLMRALADSGRRTDALRAFQTYRAFLLDEVGTEPSAAITSLDREIARASDQVVSGESLGVFLMTDIVGSTRLWADHPDAMSTDLATHDGILSRAITEHRGVVISRAGDSFVGAFERVDDAVTAAIVAQQGLAETTWQLPEGIQARMGIHLGDAQRRGEGWYGLPLNEAARMMSAAHGGQIVVSEPVAARLPQVGFVDLGEHRLRDLDGTRRLLQVTVPGLLNDFPPLRSMGSYITTLPPQRTPLIGRDDLIVHIRRLLLEHRLVSLIGPGGVGKTRAAIEASGQELANFPGGVFFVDLTSTANRAEVLAALVGGVRSQVPPDRTAEEHLAVQLGERPALIVVDNCEHVVELAAELLDGLLTATPDLRILATSREPLQIYGEHCLPVPTLSVDGPGSEGVRLFTERALAADSSIVIDDADLDTVAEIARRLDGIPLAIELAAAQIRTLTPQQVLTHLDDRFRLLRRGSRHAPERQQTLEGAVASSYDLLDADEQRAFRLLSVCAGPFTLRTAAAVLRVDLLEAAEHLDGLVNKSLVSPVRVGSRGQGYRYLETLREYGQRELAAHNDEAEARAALETALLPAAPLREDWTALVNQYICSDDLAIVIEDDTRRDAATHAAEAGRLDAAALIFSSCVFHDHPGAVETTLQLVAPLAGRRDDLDPIAWRAAVAAKVALERLTRRYVECLETSVDMLAALDADDPARGWFDSWRCALTTAVAPEVGVAETEAVLAPARRNARAPLDWTLSQLLVTKATGLAMLRRPAEARPIAEDALAWAPIGKESRDQCLAVLLWILHAMGTPSAEHLLDEVGTQRQELGVAELCAAPGALCSDGSIEERAGRLVASARRRPSTDVPTPFLLAFAWLAVEDGEAARAAELAARAEIYDSSTIIALLYLLATLQGWSADSWARNRDATIGWYLSPDHEPAAKEGFATLASEVERWDRRLSRR